MNVPHWLAHRWSKWERFEVQVTRAFEDGKQYSGVSVRQRRHCETCNLEEERVVRDGVRYSA